MNYSTGDIVEFFLHGEGTVYAVVTSRVENINDDKHGFEGLRVGTAEEVWGYDEDIKSVAVDEESY